MTSRAHGESAKPLGRQANRIVSIVALSMTAVACVTGSSILVPTCAPALVDAMLSFHFTSLPFDARKWAEATRDFERNGRREDALRRMATDLIDRSALIGLTRQEIVSMLGPPGGAHLFEDWYLYWVGPTRQFADGEFLVIRFDSQGRVDEAKLQVR